MASNLTEVQGSTRERLAKYALAGIVGSVVLVAALKYWNRPPQMGTSEQAFKTVDALYTAVRSRDERRLTECEGRLKSYRQAGQLPAAAANALDGIIARARSGAWQPAAERLYDFMLAQRREGPIESHPPAPKTTAKLPR